MTFDQILISCSLYQKNTFLKNSLKDPFDIISTKGWMDGQPGNITPLDMAITVTDI